MSSPYPASLIPQVREIRDHVDNYPTSAIVMVTDLRIIIQCPDGAIALTLSKELVDMGYTTAVLPGRLSSAYYVQVVYQKPARRAA